MQKVTIKTNSKNVRKKISTYVESSNYKSENYKTNDPEKIMPLFETKDNKIIVNSGKIIIEEPIVIKNKDFVIKEGVELIFKKTHIFTLRKEILVPWERKIILLH